MPAPTSTRLLPRLRQWFQLSQPELGRCFGLSGSMVSQVERGVRPLPLTAALPQAVLTAALHVGEASPEPPPEPADATALRRQWREAGHRAGQLAHELTRMQERAAWARRRLAALPALTAAFAGTAPGPPPWLARFESKARHELARSGTTAQALLAARQAGLQAEAAALAQLLGESQNG